MNAVFVRVRVLKSFVPVLLLVLLVGQQGCSWLFPPASPPGATQSLGTVLFTDRVEWLRLTTGVVMSVHDDGRIASAGDTLIHARRCVSYTVYNPEGMQTYYGVDDTMERIIREMEGGYLEVSDVFTTPIGSIMINLGRLSGSYTRYNTLTSRPASNLASSMYGGLREVVGPSITKGKTVFATDFPGRIRRVYATWVAGSFTDAFLIYGETMRTQGKADCFILQTSGVERGQYLHWGGEENDLAYDIASDEVGNPTIFLRAGTEFGITSATQTLVRMNTGYNIVRLDTNGLLTETFPVRLEAEGEITDAKIALGRGGVVYILAQDEVRQQAFLAKVTRAGTVWIRYFDPSVCIKGYYYSFRRMDLCVDSQNNVYITSGFTKTADMGNGVGLMGQEPLVYAFVAKYSPNNECLGALNMGGNAMGITIRLAPDERSLYVNGWADGTILGQQVPNRDNIRQGIMQPGAFLVKLKLK
jgi:hypothetical protein